MHIADGILPTAACAAGHVAAAAAVWAFGRRVENTQVVRMGMIASAVFVASSAQFPVAGTSMHLGLYGLAGIVLGSRAFPVIWVTLLFQTLLLQHGGLLSLGINAVNMGLGAAAAAGLWKIAVLPLSIRAFLAGFAGVMLPAFLMALEFAWAGYGRGFLWIAALYSIVALIEAGVTVFIVTFLHRVKPLLLRTPA